MKNISKVGGNIGDKEQRTDGTRRKQRARWLVYIQKLLLIGIAIWLKRRFSYGYKIVTQLCATIRNLLILWKHKWVKI